MISPNQFDRTARMLISLSGEDSGIIKLSGTTFVYYGSELACLRLLAKYRDSPNANTGYSDNLKTFTFSLLVNS